MSVLRRDGDSWVTLAWDGDVVLDRPDKGSEIIDLTEGAVLVILDGQLTTDDRAVLRAFAAQIVQALEREELEREAGSAEAMAETDRLRTALLGAVSHDLRTPLATIKASVTSSARDGRRVDPRPDFSVPAGNPRGDRAAGPIGRAASRRQPGSGRGSPCLLQARRPR